MLSSDRCYEMVFKLSSSFEELGKIIAGDDIIQLYNSCQKLSDAETSDRYSEPMLWIGIYIAIASFYCIVMMAVDLYYGYVKCKYFSLNTASITVITVAMKLQVDLSSTMSGYEDQVTKVGGLGFMCVMMVNLMPSLASMDNNTLLANIIGLCILVITVIVNICIQINTKVILSYNEDYFRLGMTACIDMAMIILLLIIMISSSLTLPTTKEILESKYQATNKISLTDPHLQHTQLPAVEKLRHYVTRYWVMAETGSPQFVMASNPLSIASALICVVVALPNYFLVIRFVYQTNAIKLLLNGYLTSVGSSPYKWSTIVIFLTQSIGIVIGSVGPIKRCFLVYDFKLGTKWNKKYFMFFKVEKFWTQKLHEWKQSPVLFLSSHPRSRSLIYTAKIIILSLCIQFQKVIVMLCKFICLVVAVPIFVASYFTRPVTPRTSDIDEDLRGYALQIDNEAEFAERTWNRIAKSMKVFISQAEKEKNNNLLELLEKSTGFGGVEIFDIDHVQPLLPVEPVNSWSLPIVTLTCIVVSLPDVHNYGVESLTRSVGEGLSLTHLVEESLNKANEYVNIRKTTMILWDEVENNCKWLDNTLAKSVFKEKTVIEVVEWFSDKAKEIVTAEINESTNGDMVDNSPKTLIAANSMYRITQTILFRYRSNTEPITNKQLFDHINGMIADIFCACFTNLPRVIRMKCHESVIEKREESVKAAAKLLGKTKKIIEKLETRELPSMDDENMAYIDEWRLCLKQYIP